MYRNLFVIGAGCCLCLLVFVLTFTGDARPRADFIWNNDTEPLTLDPTRMSGQPEGEIALALFEGLTTYHPKTLQPTPGVAKSWQIDGLTYTFFLREDAWWVKGTEIYRTEKGPHRVTAHDFLRTWRAHAYPETGSDYAFLFQIIVGYEQYKQAVERQWREITSQYIGDDERGNRRITRPSDLDAGDREKVHHFREELWQELVNARALDDFTLEIKLRAAAPYFLTVTSFYAFFPIPVEVKEEHGEEWVLPENIVTNGPYTLENWRFNAFIRLRKNPHYWETDEYVRSRLTEINGLSATPALKRERDLLERLGSFGQRGLEIIEALAVEEENTSLNLYLNGDVDRIGVLPVNVVGELIDASRESPGLPHLHHAPQLVVYFYVFNLNIPVFQGTAGLKLRKAMALALDRQGLIDTVTRERQEPAYNLVPPGVPDYPSRRLLGCGSFEGDVKEAQRLIAEVRAEVGPLPRLKILYNTSESHAKIAAFIQDGWRRHLGLACDLTNQEWGVFLTSRKTGNFIIARMGWIGDYLDANTFLDLYTTGNPNNDCKHENPFYDRLVLQYVAHVDEILRHPARRNKMLEDLMAHPLYSQDNALRRAMEAFDTSTGNAKLEAAYLVRRLLLELAEEVLLHDYPVIPIYFYTRAKLWPPELEGMESNLIDSHPPKFLRWKGDSRPSGSRYSEFPRLSP